MNGNFEVELGDTLVPDTLDHEEREQNIPVVPTEVPISSPTRTLKKFAVELMEKLMENDNYLVFMMACLQVGIVLNFQELNDIYKTPGGVKHHCFLLMRLLYREIKSGRDFQKLVEAVEFLEEHSRMNESSKRLSHRMDQEELWY
jgi:hypothetical protein